MTEIHKRANRHSKYKTAYRVQNWRPYDQALRDRGDITLWLSQEGRSVSVQFVQPSRDYMVEYL
jgi:hypothetical protein